MCNSHFHVVEDDALLRATPAQMATNRDAWLMRLRGHPYGEMCCTIELVGDGHVRLGPSVIERRRAFEALAQHFTAPTHRDYFERPALSL